MKKIFFLCLITLTTFAQNEKLSIGMNVVPLALNRTIDLPVEYRFDSTRSITVNVGATFNNSQDYALCIQCAGGPRVKSLDAFSIKVNYRKYYKNKRKSQKFVGIGAVVGRYNKEYNAGAMNFLISNESYTEKRTIFSPNIQLGRSRFLSKKLNLDFGTQLNWPIKYIAEFEPSHYTPTRGMGIINLFLVLKYKIE